MVKRIYIIFVAAVLTLLFCACRGDFDDRSDEVTDAVSTDTNETMNNEPTNTYRQIGMAEAVDMMQEETDYIILDVRRADEFAAGHIPNAINVANEDICTAEIAALPHKDQLILVYCRSGRRSKEAAEKLVALGYTNIVEFGGILDWTGDIET